MIFFFILQTLNPFRDILVGYGSRDKFFKNRLHQCLFTPALLIEGALADIRNTLKILKQVYFPRKWGRSRNCLLHPVMQEPKLAEGQHRALKVTIDENIQLVDRGQERTQIRPCINHVNLELTYKTSFTFNWLEPVMWPLQMQA